MLFNLAIDFIYREICDPQYSNVFGYRLHPEHTAISLTGFANDQTISSSIVEHAIRTVELVQDRFKMIGLSVNPRKSTAICIKNGRLAGDELELSDGSRVRCLQKDERIKYLGCTFTSELVFDPDILNKLTNNMNNLLKSPLLQKDQKINILNQYLPRLTYLCKRPHSTKFKISISTHWT